MKKLLSVILMLALAACLTACGDSEQAASKASGSQSATVAEVLETNTGAAQQSEKTGLTAAQLPAAPADVEIDLDLTKMNANMIYAEVSSIMTDPSQYVGKIVRMQGPCYSVYYDATGLTYYAVIIQDATACCSQGLEYILADETLYPADDTEIVVTGRFETYEELGTTYCHLVDATIARA